jgi:hypothetical protein
MITFVNFFYIIIFIYLTKKKTNEKFQIKLIFDIFVENKLLILNYNFFGDLNDSLCR